MLISLNQRDSYGSREEILLLLVSIISLLNCFDVLMDSGISADTVLVHL